MIPKNHLGGFATRARRSCRPPRSCRRFSLRWSYRWGGLLLLFAVINLVIELWFQASVREQRGAYATGVLVLISSACIATVLHKKARTKGEVTAEKPANRFWILGGYVVLGIF